MPDEKTFSVYWWPVSGGERIEECRWVTAEFAVGAFRRLTTGPARLITERVILTDGGDCINIEWKRDEGCTYPGDPRSRAAFPPVEKA